MITFKRTTPRNLSAIGKKSGMAIQALKVIGKGKVEEWEENKIIQILKTEDESKLKHDIKMAPEWIRVIMRKALVPKQQNFKDG